MNSIKWHIYPMVKAAIPFGLGILCYKSWPYNLNISLGLLLALFTFLFFGYFFKWKSTYFVCSKSFLIYVLFFLLGYIRAYTAQPQIFPSHYSNYISGATTFYGVVQEVPIERTSLKTEVKVTKICDDITCIDVDGGLLVYFKKDIEIAKAFLPGDLIKCRSNIGEIRQSKNPHTFDFKEYLLNRGITNQAYIWKADQIEIIDHNQLQGIYQLAMHTRNWCLGVLNKYVESGDKIAIVSALILGYRNLINQDVYAAFSDTGAVHILAVSGMHLTLISGALFLILRLLKIQNKYLRIVLQLACIWFFTLITGIGAAILRAAVMLTFLILAKENKQPYNIYNVIGLVCFLIFLYEPGQLFQAGFQFSICAVLSLMFFQEIIEGQWQPENRLLGIGWNLVSTSISATILVVPLTIYFFHKFPLYFVLSGLLPVLSSTFAMYVGLVMMILEAIHLGIINHWLAYLINFLLEVFLQSIVWIKNLPFCSIDGLTLSTLEFGCTMASIFLVMFYISTRNIRLIYSLGALVIVTLSSLVWRVHMANHQTKMIVYDVNKNGSIDFIDGRTIYNYTVEPLDKIEESFIYQNNRYFHFTDEVIPLDADDELRGERILISQNDIRFKDKRIYILRNNSMIKDVGHYDYIYLTNNIEFNDKIEISPKNYCIIDKSFDFENYRNWIEYLEQKGIPFHDVKSKGSFTTSL